MIRHESRHDVHDVSCEIDQNSEQCAELNDGNRGRGLFSLQGFISAAVKIYEACCENEMCRGANRDEFRQALDQAEEDSLKNGHQVLFSKRIPLRNPIVHRCRHQPRRAHDGCELPWESVSPLFPLNRRNNLLHSVLELHQVRHFCFAAGGECGLDETRMNDRHADARMAQIDSETLKIRGQRRFACAVSRRLGESTISSQTRDRDQPPLLALHHFGQHCRNTINGAQHIYPDHVRGVFRRQPNGVIRSADSRIGNEDVDWSKLFAKAIRSFPDGLHITYVGTRSNSFNITRACFTDDLVQQILAACQQSEMRATRRDLKRNSPTDPGRGPGDHHDLVGPVSHLDRIDLSLNQHDYRRDHRPRTGLFLNKPLQLHSHVLFQKRLVRQRLPRCSSDRRRNDTLRLIEHWSARKTIFRTHPTNTARNDLRLTIELASLFIYCYNDRYCAFVSELLALTHGLAVDLFKSTLVDERAANLTLVDDRRALAIQLEHVAILDQDDVLFGVTEMVFDKLLVTEEHPVFTVNRHDKLRTHSFRHDSYVFLRSVPADVYETSFLFDDVGAALVDESDHARDYTLVAGNDARRQHDRVALFDHQPFVTLRRHLRERRTRLALRSGNQKHDLVVAHHLGFVQRHEQPVRNVEITESICNLDILLHRTPEHTDVSIKLLRNVEHDLQTMNRRSKSRNDDAPLRFRKDLFERRNHCALRRRATRNRRVCGIG